MKVLSTLIPSVPTLVQTSYSSGTQTIPSGYAMVVPGKLTLSGDNTVKLTVEGKLRLL